MKRNTMGLLLTVSVMGCCAFFAGCGTANKGNADASVVESVSDSIVETQSVVDGQIKDTTEILEGDFSIDDCIKLGKYEGLKLTKYVSTVTDEDIKAYASSMKEAEEVTDKDAGVQDGDILTIAFNTYIEGKEIQELCSDSYDIQMGSNAFIVEGFEEGLIGMKIGESKEMNLVMPSDYGDAIYAGKDVRFVTTILTIRRFAEPTAEEIEDAGKKLQHNYDMNSQNQLRLDAWAAVEEDAEIMYLPAQYVDEAKAVFDEITENEAQNTYQTDLQGYLEILQLTEEEYMERKDQYARYATRSRLVLEALEKALNVSKEDPEYENELKEYCDYLGATPEELISTNGESAVKDYIQTQRVCDRLIELADVTEVKE